MQITTRPRPSLSGSPSPRTSPPAGPSVADRFVAAAAEGTVSGLTGAATGAVGAHLGMARLVHKMGASWSASLSWLDPTVVTVGAVAGGVLAAGAGALLGGLKGNAGYNPTLSAGLGVAAGAGAGSLAFIALMNHATSGAAYFG